MELAISTDQSVAVIDITGRVQDELPADSTGTCTVFVPHTTAGITVNENESRLVRDIESILGQLIPDGTGYAHDAIDDNAAAHLRSMLVGSHVTVPVTDGSLDLGTWQSILFVESDGPRNRRVVVRSG